MGVESSGRRSVEPQFAPVKVDRSFAGKDIVFLPDELDETAPLDCGLEGLRDRPVICVNNRLRFPESHQHKLCTNCFFNPANPVKAEANLLFGEADEDISPEVFSLYFPLEEGSIEKFRKRRKKLFPNESQQLRAFAKYISRLPKTYREKAAKRAMRRIKKTGPYNLGRLNSVIDFKSKNINAS